MRPPERYSASDFEVSWKQSVLSESQDLMFLNKNATQLTVSVSGELQNFIKVLSGYKVLTMESIPQTLEETFTYLYGGDLSD